MLRHHPVRGVELPAPPKIPGRVGVEVTPLEKQPEAHHVGANRWLPTRQVLIVPGRAERVEHIGNVMSAIEPSALVRVKRTVVDVGEVGDARGEEEGERESGVEQRPPRAPATAKCGTSDERTLLQFRRGVRLAWWQE